MPTYAGIFSGGSSSGTSDRTAAGTPSVGESLIVVCTVAANTNNTPTCSDNQSGGSYTRVLVGDATISAINYRLSVFVRNNHVTSAVSHTITVATGSNTSGEIHVIRVASPTRTGSQSPIRSSGQQNNAAAGTPAPVLNQAALTGNMTIVGVMSADTTTTPPASWTERADLSQTNDTVANEVATRDSGFTGTTITFGAAQSTVFASFALELDGTSPISGTAAGTGTATGAITGTAAISGSAAGVGAATATGQAIASGSGTAAGVGTATGTLVGTGVMSGTAAGVGTAAGAATGQAAVAGSSAGTGTATGTLQGTAALSGASAGVGTAAASLTGTAAVSGSSAGVGALAGTLENAGGEDPPEDPPDDGNPNGIVTGEQVGNANGYGGIVTPRRTGGYAQ